MVWTSTTQVARISVDAKETLWPRVCELRNVRKVIAPAVCCYALQGNCSFGQQGCRYSHDTSRAWSLGCQYGTQCKCGHPKVHHLAEDDRPRQANGLDQGVMQSAKSAAEEEMYYLESTGPEYDDTDPLWDEVTNALREGDDDTRASELSNSLRDRLAKAGQYKSLDEDMVEEWICVPGETFLSRLDTPLAKLRRREALVSELHEARCLWKLDRAVNPRTDNDKNDAMSRTDTALGRVFDVPLTDGDEKITADVETLARRVLPVSRQIQDLLDEASNALDSRLAALRAKVIKSAGGDPNSAPPGPVKSPEGLQELLDLQRCVGRCAVFAHAWAADRAATDCPCNDRALLEMARRAAKCGEHLLVHHLVTWSGSDVE